MKPSVDRQQPRKRYNNRIKGTMILPNTPRVPLRVPPWGREVRLQMH